MESWDILVTGRSGMENQVNVVICREAMSRSCRAMMGGGQMSKTTIASTAPPKHVDANMLTSLGCEAQA